MNIKPYSATVLAIARLILAGIGIYFMFLRPSLLPEDLSYMGSNMKNVQENLPGLLIWLQNVFWVMGCYIFTTGVLTVFISLTSFRSRLHGSIWYCYAGWYQFHWFNDGCKFYDRFRFQVALAEFYTTVGHCINPLSIAQMRLS